MRTRARSLLAAGALLAAAVTTLGAPAALAAAGDLDPTFSADGRVTVDAGCEDEAGDIVQAPDLTLVAVGSVCHEEPGSPDPIQVYTPGVVRLTSGGVPDTSFGGDGVVTTTDDTSRFASVAVHGSAESYDIFAAGYLGHESSDDVLVVRFSQAGVELDRFAGHVGAAGNQEAIDDIRVDANGAVSAAGTTCTVTDDVFDCYVFALRLTPTLDLDTTFSGDGKALSAVGNFSTAHLLADGRVAAVDYDEPNDTDRVRLFAADLTGPSPGFAPTTAGARALPFYGYGITSTATHLFVAGELFEDLASDQGVAKISLADGSFDTTFSGDGVAISDLGGDEFANDVTVGADGLVYTAGGLNTGNAATVARYTANGALDSAFGEGGSVRTAYAGFESASADAIIVQADGRPVIAGAAYDDDAPDLDMAFARFKAATPHEIRYTSVTPQRILDTRPGSTLTTDGRNTPLGPNGTFDLQVVNKAGVPATGVSAVVLNVTAITPTAPGFVAAYPAGSTFSGTSNLNFVAKQTVANLVTVKVGDAGKVTLLNSAGTTNLAVDIQGWYSDGENAVVGGEFKALTPVRALDTRPTTPANSPNDGVNNIVGPGQTITLDVVGFGPDAAAAIVLNLTVTGPTGAGFISAYPTGGEAPEVSNVNFTKGQTVANLSIVRVGFDGTISIFNKSNSTHILADVAGYFTAADTTGTTGRFQALTPSRILDTRAAIGTPTIAKVGPGQQISVQITGRGRVPTSGVSAVVMNVTAVAPTSAGFLTVFPSGVGRPTASNVNFVAGRVVPNSVIVKLGTDGKVTVYNHAGSTHVLFDVAGWYS